MCGRYALHSRLPRLAALFGVRPPDSLRPRYNIAPSQDAPVVRCTDAGREWVALRWGLLPPRVRTERPRFSMINARAETLAHKPAYRAAFRRRRCLVPADGFYEWRVQGGVKRPWHIRRRDGEPFAFAGLWERWEGEGRVIESFTIVVTEACEALRPIHARMPVILDRDEYDLWLDPGIGDPARLEPLLDPYPADRLEAYRVSTYVNRPEHEGERCIAPEA